MLPVAGAELPEFPVVGVSLVELAGLLDGVELADLSFGGVVSVVQGFEQLIRAAQAAQAVAVRELDVRRPVHPSVVPDQLACALVSTRRSAQLLHVRACLTATHPSVHEAWAAGTLDARKVDVLLAEVMLADPAARDTTVRLGLAAAPRMTAPQLARHLRAAVIATDPDAAQTRQISARADRAVSLTAAPDGMAWLSAYLPAPEAVMAFSVLDALAGTTRIGADQRSVDQRRADAFADVFTTILHRQTTPDGTPLPRRHGQAITITVTVAATTLLGLDQHPAQLGSYGPITAAMARELAQDGTWRRLLTDPAGLVTDVATTTYRPGADLTRTIIARDVTCTFPGCRQPATRCDLDHITPYDPSQPAHTQTTADNLHALCRHHHQAKTKKHWNVHRNPTTGVTWWTSADGLTFARHPTPAQIDYTALTTHPPPPPRHSGTAEDRPPPF